MAFNLNDINDLMASLFLFLSVFDVVMGKFIMPRLIMRNPKAKPQSAHSVQIMMYAASFAMLVLAIGVHVAHPIAVHAGS